MTHIQLAEEWIMRSCKILERPYSRHAYATAIEEAEQFLWAGPEMELVSLATLVVSIGFHPNFLFN